MLLLAGLIAARSSDADQENVRSASELRPFKPCTSGGPGAISTTLEEMLEAGVGIERAKLLTRETPEDPLSTSLVTPTLTPSRVDAAFSEDGAVWSSSSITWLPRSYVNRPENRRRPIQDRKAEERAAQLNAASRH